MMLPCGWLRYARSAACSASMRSCHDAPSRICAALSARAKIFRKNNWSRRVSHWFDQCDLKRFDRSGNSTILLRGLDETTEGGSLEDRYQSLAHAKWECTYHLVCVPKRRRRQL